jgi:hypothetical protein
MTLLDLYSGGSQFESRPGHRVSLLRIFVGFLITSRYIPGQILIRPRPLPSKFFYFIKQPTIRLYIV